MTGPLKSLLNRRVTNETSAFRTNSDFEEKVFFNFVLSHWLILHKQGLFMYDVIGSTRDQLLLPKQ